MTHAWSDDDLVAFWRQMLLIRRFEERCLILSRQGTIAGSIHLCVGQEAVAVGAASALRPQDITIATYRGHGHVLARGVDVRAAFAEILGRATGLCAGRGGSMHLTDVAHGVLPPNSIVGAGLPIATGVALAQVNQERDAVVLCAFGEGTLNQGGALEALNLAAVWRLPVVFLCENNQYAEMTPAYDMIAVPQFTDRVAGFGLPTTQVDGMDVCAVADSVTAAVARARAGAGPSFIEAATYRYLGHYQGDPGTSYRATAEIDAWKARDPLVTLRATIEQRNAALGERITAISAAIETMIEITVAAALNDPFPLSASLEEYVYATD